MNFFETPKVKAMLEAQRAREAAAQAAGLPMFADPPHNGTDTSKAAARSVAPKAATMRRQVLVALMFAPKGLTRSEIVTETGMLENSVNGRSRELLDAGLAYEDGERDGRKVVHITDAGLRALDQQEAA